MIDSAKDLFSGHSDIYAKYRPRYPKELYDFIFDLVEEKERALDCGTGNGQAAGVLATVFKEVHATDISDKQITNAVEKSNLHYHICKAEETPFEDDYFDLITVATAVHWFQFNRFFEEMRRIGKNNSVFACWAYKVIRTDSIQLNELIDRFYTQIIRPYWDPERRHVDEEYRNIPFPFDEIKNPGFETNLEWNLETLEGFINTWSAVQHYINKNQTNPVAPLIKEMSSIVAPGDIIRISFPIFMRIGFIRK